jgi:hypothetical protein
MEAASLRRRSDQSASTPRTDVEVLAEAILVDGLTHAAEWNGSWVVAGGTGPREAQDLYRAGLSADRIGLDDHVRVNQELVELVGLVVEVEGAVGFVDVTGSHDRPHEVPQQRVRCVHDLVGLPCLPGMGHQAGVERLVVEVAHGQRRGSGPVHLQRSVVEIAEGFASDLTVAGGLPSGHRSGMASDCRTPSKSGPRQFGSWSGRSHGRRCAHHDMEEDLLGRCGELGSVVEKCDIDAACAVGIGMRDPICAGGKELVDGPGEQTEVVA